MDRALYKKVERFVRFDPARDFLNVESTTIPLHFGPLTGLDVQTAIKLPVYLNFVRMEGV